MIKTRISNNFTEVTNFTFKTEALNHISHDRFNRREGQLGLSHLIKSAASRGAVKPGVKEKMQCSAWVHLTTIKKRERA